MGTERGFIGAANSPNVTHLVLIDKNPSIVNYNQINILLLKMSTNRENYLRLRTSPNLNEWISSAISAGLSNEEIDFLKSKFTDWATLTSKKGILNFHRKPIPLLHPQFYKVHYMYDDKLFNAFREKARTGRIVTGVIDLSKPEEVRNVVVQLEEKKIPLSVLDVSNAWRKDYIAEESFVTTVQQFDHIASPHSYLLLTDTGGIIGMPLTIISRLSSGSFRWTYAADTFGRIRSYDSVDEYVKWLHFRQAFRLGARHLEIRKNGTCLKKLRMFLSYLKAN